MKGTIYKLPQRTGLIIWQLSIIDVVQSPNWYVPARLILLLKSKDWTNPEHTLPPTISKKKDRAWGIWEARFC